MADISDETKVVAQRLSLNDRYSSNSTVEVFAGLSVPAWLLFVSEATRLIAERDALKAK